MCEETVVCIQSLNLQEAGGGGGRGTSSVENDGYSWVARSLGVNVVPQPGEAARK